VDKNVSGDGLVCIFYQMTPEGISLSPLLGLRVFRIIEITSWSFPG